VKLKEREKPVYYKAGPRCSGGLADHVGKKITRGEKKKNRDKKKTTFPKVRQRGKEEKRPKIKKKKKGGGRQGGSVEVLF